MAAAVPDRLRQPSPNPEFRNTQGLSINLSSNNPFRNRAVSPNPAATSPRSLEAPADNRAQNRMSRNPFLDVSEFNAPPPQRSESAGIDADIFKDLSLLDKPANGGAPPPPRAAPQPPLRAPPRAGTAPLSGMTGHRPGGSDDRRDRPRGPPPPRGQDSPDKRMPPRRPRGLSESSVVDKDREMRRERDRSERPPRSESEERRRRERRREREERHKREKEKVRGGAGRSGTKRNQGLDIIDKLDVTGIYGQGLFHHDGPFDACNPHRNTKKDRRAPMQAFPAGSANMALGGNGPLNSRLDLDRFHGRGEEAFETFTHTRKPDTNIVDPARGVEEVHGDPSNGLGTSTFLEGAPASRRDLQRRDSEDATQQFGPASSGGGLTRKKSLAQRLRGMSAARRGPGGEVRSPDARYYDSSPPGNKAISAGGPARARYNKENEINPFDNDYEDAYEKKGTQIRIAEQTAPGGGSGSGFGGPGSGSGGRMGGQLQRSVTADSAVGGGEVQQGSGGGGSGGGSGSGGGFLSRMKSLKGGRRARPERRGS